MKIGYAAGVLLALALGTAGCSMSRQVADFSIDYNRAVARSRNEMLLINILRAKDREPYQFTTVSSVVGSLEMTGSVEAAADKLVQWRTGSRPKDFGSLSPTLTLSASSKPTFTVQPLSDKDFTKQMLMPIPPETVSLLLEQNWSSRLVLSLVVGSIDCADGRSFDNTRHSVDPQLPDELEKQGWNATLSPDRSGSIMLAGVNLDASKVLETATKAGNDRYEAAALSPTRQAGVVDVAISEKKPGWIVRGLPQVCGPGVIDGIKVRRSGDQRSAMQPNVKLRSIESIIYYLGEAMRYGVIPAYWEECTAQTDDRYCEKRDASGRGTVRKTIFEVKTGPATGPVAIETNVGDKHYWIPAQTDRYSTDRTLSTLSFLSELIALQTSEDRAVPQPVIAVGR